MPKVFTGNLWDAPTPNWICIPSNGTVNKQGNLVMGAGFAKQAAERWTELPALAGSSVRASEPAYGAKIIRSPIPGQPGIILFQTKYHWGNPSYTELIRRSCNDLRKIAEPRAEEVFYLPCPGIGHGQLSFAQVWPILEAWLPDNITIFLGHSPKDLQ